MNPYSVEMMKAYHNFCALNSLDDNFAEYIKFASTVGCSQAKTDTSSVASGNDHPVSLKDAIIKGLSDKARAMTQSMLESNAPLDIVKDHIIPALDVVGKGFEAHTVYLPGLLMSAEAAKAAFEPISDALSASSSDSESKKTVVLATVKGDIHDIGKNIVALLLENYGFRVIDLGRDVAPEKIVDTAVEFKAPLVGLSALMTTTVPAMEETVKLLREKAPFCKVMVGGAVLTDEYAKMIGADFYGADAMSAVRIAESV